MSRSSTRPQVDSPFLSAALEYAWQGIRVFPLEPRGKKPLGRLAPHGVNDATADEGIIRRWWTDEPHANIGIATGAVSGLDVLDVDGDEGEHSLQQLFHGTEPLTRQATTGKGRHLFYQHVDGVRNSAGKLGAKLDVRGDGGYVVAPPSIHPSGRAYAWRTSGTAPIALMPSELVEAIRNPKQEKPSTDEGNWVERLRRDGIAEGARHETLKRVAGYFARRFVPYGATLADIQALVMKFNLDAGRPPIDDEREVDELARYAYEQEAAKLGAPTRPTTKLLTRAEVAKLPPVEWLVDGMLPVDGLGVLYGDPGAAKTFLALDIGACIAAGRAWYERAVKQGAVVYVCAESPRGLATRLDAWEYANNDEQALDGFYVFPEAVQLLEPAHVTHLIEQIREAGITPRLVVFDTLARCTVGADENSVEVMGKAVAMADRVRREFGTTVLLVHHSRKGDARVIRGSSVVSGAVDTALALVKDEATGERVLSVTKQKDGEEARPLRFRLDPVPSRQSVVLSLVGEGNDTDTLSRSARKALDALLDVGPATFTEWHQASEQSRTTFDRSRKHLIDAGLVIQSGNKYRPATVPEGWDERPRY